MAMALERDRLSHFIFVVYENIILQKNILENNDQQSLPLGEDNAEREERYGDDEEG